MIRIPRPNRLPTLALALGLFLVASAAQANPPDLTAGGVPNNTRTTNLGPTGVRGWIYHVNSGGRRADTADARQILVTAVANGSPTAGILAPDDVILGADGSGADPVHFTSDARKALAYAIAEAEANSPATLKLLRWRSGTTTAVTLTLQTMGAYSATAPYNCPKSSLILQQGLAAIMSGESAGRYSFGTLSLIAAKNPDDPNNAARMARAQTEARALVPSPAVMQQMMADTRDATSMVVWERGHTLVVLAEYFLATGDEDVLPAVEAYAVNIARNSSLFGTMGHIFAEKNPDGSDNGPMGGVYGPVNNAGMPCYLGLILARECGINHPSITPMIERMNIFCRGYIGKGTVPYGEHEPAWNGHENNGKSGLAALAYTLQNDRVNEGQYYAKMATASAAERELGHTGAFFNYVWAPLGAACGGDEAAASHFSRIRWMLDLNRRWDHHFDYDCLNAEGPNSGSQYNNFRMSTAALLTYALPLRQLRITGKDHDSARWLGSADVAEAAAADGYVATSSLTINQLIADLASWSPMVQRRAAEQLATRSINTNTLNQLTALANDPNGSSRMGACLALGKNSNSSTANARAATLAALLTDPENRVRYMAAEAMRYLPQTAKMSQLNTILSAAATTAKPLFPFDEEDPLHFAHGRLAALLFYGGNAYGPKGMIWNSLSGVDRNLLYPAIRAVAANPVGFARSCLYHTYLQLTAADVNALAGTIIDSVQFRAPSDKMFSAGVRRGGIEALEKYKFAEGVPLSMIYAVDHLPSNDGYVHGLAVLRKYAGGATTVTPDPDVIGFCQALLGGTHAAAAQQVLDAIAANPNPTPLTPFKSIQSATADASSINLPANQTTLRVTASDLAKGDSIHTWRKVRGAGDVTFTPNGTATAKDSAVQFYNVPGSYVFEVTMSDSRGLTELYRTVEVTLRNPDGTLPANDPPTARPQTVASNPGTVTPITLSASDPEGYALVYSVIGQPAHGTLTGTAPDLAYTADASYLGTDSFTFQVMDSEGQTSSAMVTINVSGAGIELHAYEGFDYGVGSLTGRNGGIGFLSGWQNSNGTNESGYVWDETTNVTFDNATLNWDGALNNNFPTSPDTGARYLGASAVGSSNLNIHRQVSTNAGALADENGVLWMSAVYHLPNRGFGAGLHIGLGSGWMRERSRQFQTGDTDFIGVSPYTGSSNAWNSGNLVPVIVDSNTGSNAWQNFSRTVGPALPIGSLDMILVMKFTFGTSDTVEAMVFHEDTAMGGVTEAAFNQSKTSATYAAGIDESALNYLVINQGRFDNALDEIRIGNSFAAVIGVEGDPPDTTPPVLLSITDDRAGETMQQGEAVTYTLIFSEAMDATTIEPADFANAGTSQMLVNSVLQFVPGVVTVNVTPVTPGTLQFQVLEGAVLTDIAGNPLDTTEAITDDTIITVNPAMIDVPFVVGMPQAEAETEITGSGLAVGIVTYQYNEGVAAGSVINQNPSGGTSVAEGSAVDLVVSLGPAMTTVPDVSGLSQSAAEAAILAAGLVVGEVTTQPSSTVPAGDVISQSPDGGTSAAPGTAVDLVVSLGETTPPAPDPMTFAVAPHATGSTHISMTATTATDANGVEYYFACVSGGGNDSGWQDSPDYEDTGLYPDTPYSYTVTARDKSANQNATAPSAPASATTLAAATGNGTWIFDGDGDWSVSSNWHDHTIADGIDNTASFTANITGNRIVTLDTPRSIGNITFTDSTTASHDLEVSGDNALTLGVTSGVPQLNVTNRTFTIGSQVSGADGLQKTGAGTLVLSGNNDYTGATFVSAGVLEVNSLAKAGLNSGIGAYAGTDVSGLNLSGGTFRYAGVIDGLTDRGLTTTAGTSTIHIANEDVNLAMGTYQPTAASNLNVTGAAGTSMVFDRVQLSASGINVVLNSAIPAVIDNLHFTISTTLNPNFGTAGTGANVTVKTVTSSATNGSVCIGGNGGTITESVVLSGTGSFEKAGGATWTFTGHTFTAGSLQINGGTGGLTVGGSGTLGGGVFPGNISYNNSGLLDFASSANQILSGNITGSASTGGRVLMSGSGTLTLSGTNTYTGPTAVNSGTLALVGGSQASPITVASGASLGFTLGSPTTSTSSVDLINGTVKITGTVDDSSDYPLMSASGGITDTPVLDEPIPNYELAIRNDGTQLVLAYVGTTGAPFEIWSGGLPADEDTNGDGVANAIAWALGAADPNENATGLLPTMDNTSDPEYFIFAFNRSIAANDDPATAISVEFGSNLAGWTTAIHDGDDLIIEVTEGSPGDTVRVKLKRSTLGVPGSLFVRLRVIVAE